jgi:tetratricopeptide (TPR) repeat protein
VIALVRTYPLPASATLVLLILVTVIARREALQPAHLTSGQPTREGQRVERIAPTGLPGLAKLVGRDQKLSDLREKLRADATGIFALEGMGGVGKSALAAEITRLMWAEEKELPGGAAWISCDKLEGEDGLAELWAKVAWALGLEYIPKLPDVRQQPVALAAELARRPKMLLTLDNIEPKLDVDQVLNILAIPGHTVLLLTARQAIAPERLVAISLDPLPGVEAEDLFNQRLSLADSDRPTDDDRPDVTPLVEEVGGLPLAIELAAAYTGGQHRAVARVLNDLRQYGLDATALRDPLRPERTVKVCFDCSWQVLTVRQQQLFADLSLLAGASFPRQAAFQLAQGDASAADAPDPDGDVATLVSYALVEPVTATRLRVHSVLGEYASERLRLHPLLREYSAERLAQFPPEVRMRLGDAMLKFWLDFAEEHSGAGEIMALETDAEGLQGAMAWAHEHGRTRSLLRLVHLLIMPWNELGRRADEADMYAWANEAAVALGDLSEQCWAEERLALVDAYQGRIEPARRRFAQALTLAQESGNQHVERDALHEVAVIDVLQANFVDAHERFDRALALDRALGSITSEREEIHGLARLAVREGKLEEARSGFEQALNLAKQVSDENERTHAEREEYHELARLDEQAGRLQEARAGFEHALVLSRQLNDRFAIAMDSRHLGFVLGLIGELEQGRGLIEEALDFFQQTGDIYASGLCYWRLAELDSDERKLATSADARALLLASERANYGQALRLFEEYGSPHAETVREALRRTETV